MVKEKIIYDDYIIRSNGEILSLKKRHNSAKILKFDTDKTGYYRVTFSVNGKTVRKLVHRLIAENFIDRVDNKNFVNHIDGNKKNNTVENLEWCTRSENEKHAHKYLNKIPSMAKICINLETGIFYESITKAAICYNYNPRTLLAMISGQNKNKSKIVAC